MNSAVSDWNLSIFFRFWLWRQMKMALPKLLRVACMILRDIFSKMTFIRINWISGGRPTPSKCRLALWPLLSKKKIPEYINFIARLKHKRANIDHHVLVILILCIMTFVQPKSNLSFFLSSRVEDNNVLSWLLIFNLKRNSFVVRAKEGAASRTASSSPPPRTWRARRRASAVWRQSATAPAPTAPAPGERGTVSSAQPEQRLWITEHKNNWFRIN